jgi:ADP-ribose pyrophosphatase
MPEGTSISGRALDAYDALIEEHPQLVAGRAMRPIVLDRREREEFVARTGTLLGVVAENPYFYVVVDLVARKGHPGTPSFPYVRVVQRKQLEGAPGVAIVATIASPWLGTLGDIVVVRQERHATGRLEMEIPRGFGEPGESSPDAALRELVEETGFVGARPRALGSIGPDTGIQDGFVTIFHADVIDRVTPRNEQQEAIAAVSLISPAQLAASIRDGICRDSFTVAALAFFLGVNA